MIKAPKQRAVAGVKAKISPKKAIKQESHPLPVKRRVKKPIVKEEKTVKIEKKTKAKISKARVKLPEAQAIAEAKNDSVKFIPGQVSLRLKERVALYRAWYQKKDSLARVATQVFGYFFIAFGLLSAFMFSQDSNPTNLKMLASLSCAVGKCSELSIEPATTINGYEDSLPQVSFSRLSAINPDQDTPFNISTKQISKLNMFILDNETGKRTPLEANNELASGYYEYTLPNRSLKPGQYEIYAEAISTSNLKAEFRGPTFNVDLPLPLATKATTTSLIIEEAMSPDNFDHTSSSTKEEPPLETTMEAEEISTTSDQVTTVVQTAGAYPGQQKIFIKSIEKFLQVELSARLKNSNQTFYLGEASPIEHGFVYWLDTNSLPAGDYQILIEAVRDQTTTDYLETQIVVEQNDEMANNLSMTNEAQTDHSDIKQLASSSKPKSGLLIGSIASPLSFILNSDTTSTNKNEIEAKKILEENSNKFTDLINRYTSTNNSSELKLSPLVEKAIDDKVIALLTSRVENSLLQGTVNDVGTALKSKITDLKERAMKLKSLKEQGIDSQYLVDSDNDGLLDYEEINFYHTDNKRADSDSDGVVDGIEVSLGFNPLDATPEAVIDYYSPLERTYTDVDLLGISNIAPLLVYETNEEKPKIQTEITGYSLPDSFVTIYVFSEPTILVAKTNDNGFFSITLSRELADGQHKAYIALTDNYGRIIVKGDTYGFLKNGPTFSRSDSTQTASLLEANSAIDQTNFNPYTIMSLGLVSLGLILLLLAQSLRRENGNTTAVPV